MSRFLSSFSYVSVLMLLFSVALVGTPHIVHAEALIADETVDNVTIKTLPDIVFEDGTNLVAASSVLQFNDPAIMVNNDYLLISHTSVNATSVCFYIDKTGGLANDGGTPANCQSADGVPGGVEVDISGATTVAQVAALMHAAINGVGGALAITSTNNGGGSLTLTNDTAGAAGNIAPHFQYWTLTFEDLSTLQDLAGGTDLVAAEAVIEIDGGLADGADDQSIEIDGVVIALGADELTEAEIATAIDDADLPANGDDGDYALVVAGNEITFTRGTAGAAGNGELTIEDAEYSGDAQEVTFTPTDVANHHRLIVTIDDEEYIYSGPSSVQDAVEGLLAEIEPAATTVTCTEDNVRITCSAAVAGTPFTYSAAVETISNGGGRSSSKKKADVDLSDLYALIAKLQAELAALMNGNPSPVADLTVGSNGTEVTALQNFLIGKGYAIPAGATGYFGAQTQSALAAYQAAVGISPAAGYYGPKTRAYMQANP